MKDPVAYQNGKYLPAERLAIPVNDAGFVWGATVTDRVRTFNGRLFRLREHLQRFREGCSLARVPMGEPDEQIVSITEHLVRENRDTPELSVIWIATPGPLSDFAPSEATATTEPTFIAYTRPIDQLRASRMIKSGVSLFLTPSLDSIDERIKHRSRLKWWIAKDKLSDRFPIAQPLFYDPFSNWVLETATSNVLLVLEEKIISPPPRRALEGVSLGVVHELCHRIGLTFVRRDLDVNEMSTASEIILSNTTDCLAGVSYLDGLPIPFPGPILGRLLDAWSDLVGVDLRRQMSGDS